MRSIPLHLPAILPVAVTMLWLVGTPAARAQCPAAEPVSTLETYDFPSRLESDPPIDSRNACPSWRWVAIRAEHENGCPGTKEAREDDDWSVEPLYSDAIEPGLRPFCIYEVERADGNTSDELRRRKLEGILEELLLDGRLLEVESGCAAVGPVADSLPTPNLEHLRLLEEYFYEESGDLPGWKGLAFGGDREDSSHVRVTLIDTQPTGLDSEPGKSEHGFALAHIIRRLTCQDLGAGARCAARVRTRLGLPIDLFDVHDPEQTRFNWTEGGFFGTIDQLGDAIHDELEAWDSDMERLVLNLSVAWVGERFGGLEDDVEDMPTSVKALYEVLRVASCRGALVLAAAGNRVGGPAIESGPLMPAAWEQRPAPPSSLCPWLLGEVEGPPQSAGDPSGEPLVYAVGGVHGDGSSLVNARPDSEPPRVAYADHAIVSLSQGPPAVLTGSSVATAVVSAAAATVWRHRPDLERAALMEALERSGRPLGRRAAVFQGRGTPPDVRRIGVCSALLEACSNPGACPDLGSEPISCPESAPLPRVSAIEEPCAGVDPARVQNIDLVSLDGLTANQDYCGRPTLRFSTDGDVPDRPCPFRQFFGIHARPWTGPQPNDDPCSGCSVSPPPDEPGVFLEPGEDPTGMELEEYRLWVQIDPDWQGPPLQDGVLGVGGVRLPIGHSPLQPGHCLLVHRIPAWLFQASGDRSAQPVLHFYTRQGSLESPVFLGQ